MRNPGIIYETDDGKFALALQHEQELEFVYARKMFVHLYEDQLLQRPVMQDGQPKKVLKSLDKLKQVGYSD